MLCGVALGLLAGCNNAGGKDDGGSTATDAAVCVDGSEGCACAAGACGKNNRGEQLLCQGDVCQTMSCSAGGTGCACRGGTDCDVAGDSCSNGFCVAGNCTPGTKDCACLTGTCNAGLACLQGSVCVDSTGFEGGACLANGRCNRGNMCDSSTNKCVFCTPGSAGCACTQASGCNSGLSCFADLCVSGNELPPASPKCFTPCRADLTTADGGSQHCDSDGLIEGCLDGQTCSAGSCLGTGDTKPSCTSDVECPFFQTCLQGGCYSNCDVNADCSLGKSCVKHVCRSACSVTGGSAACASGQACTANDGQTGFCTPLASAAKTRTALPSGGFDAPVKQVDLSNVRPGGSFTLVPQSSSAQDITVRKLWHAVTYADGTTERVDAPKDAKGDFRACDPAKNECPLWWLSLSGPTVPASASPTIAFRLLPGCADTVTQVDAGAATPCPAVSVTNAGGISAVRWQGAIEVTSRDARITVNLTYVERPEGQWTGSMYYFGTFNTRGVADWVNSTDKSNVVNVENGLLQRWGALRLGNIADGWQEFLAVLTATRTESWKFGIVNDKCRLLNGNSNTVACYPYTNSAGMRVYVQDKGIAPIPSGVTELPVAMNMLISKSNPSRFEGRIVSSMAMHYPGNPALNLEFAGDPSKLSSCFARGGGTDCLVFLKDINGASLDANRLESDLGGRYLPGSAPCATGYVAADVPWLVPGFVANTDTDTAGVRFRRECRESLAPFDAAANVKNAALNASLSGGNPVLDGNGRKRSLRFIDGALVNQSELFILFEESYASFIPGQPPTVAYGYMRLKRAAANLTDADYVGLQPSTQMTTSPIDGGVMCDANLLRDIPNSTDKSNLIQVLMNGSSSASAGYKPVPALTTGIHYFCEDTGKFNGGEFDDGTANAVRVACPAGSKVIYFNVCSFQNNTYVCKKTPADIMKEPCQTNIGPDGRARCFDTLQQWVRNSTISEPLASPDGSIDATTLPFFQCTNTSDVYCDDNRLDLRAKKTFYARVVGSTTRSFMPLRPLIDAAFRYKTRFRSSVSGGTLGFAPQQCVPNSDSIPYCYDPAQIEEARTRVDCLVNLYSDKTVMDSLSDPLRTAVQTFLRQNFSTFGAGYDGFERLNAELLIMQGDESLTAAYASRFDLAAAGGASFKGSTFEPGGIDLTGVAGAEMYRLYQAIQYYQLALDRMYQLGPNMHTAMTRGAVGSDPNFISPEMVTSYLERLIRAASQKSVAWSQVAKRYQNFNRPDLARSVIERAYVGTYLESAMINFLMLDIAAASSSASLPQIRITIETAQRNYRMALLDMRGVYQQISDQQNFFGFPADYIPFPALDSSSVSTNANAYDTLSTIAKQRLDLAKTREQVALTFGKQGKVDAAQFQSDLTSIRNTYENQLAQLCGTFTADDGRAYPAIRKYAPLSSLTILMGDPCGRTGNGDLYAAMAGVKDSGLKLQGVLLHHENLLKQIDGERKRAADQCALISDLADYQYSQSGKLLDMQQEIAKQRALTSFISGSVQAVISSIEVADCEIQCASSIAMAATVAATGVAAAGGQYASDLRIAEQERALHDFDRDSVKMTTNSQCGATKIDSTANIAILYNETLEVQLEALRAEYGMRLSMSEVQKLTNNAQRLEAQQEETEQLSINIQAAQNDPNVRIYQNDSVINADVSFNDALSMAYRLTRVYEYYTSQSYAKKEQLFLIRMVTAGQYNLENYLLELDNEFQNFQEQFGHPDLRVIALSLRDDILKVPYIDEKKQPISENDRINLMRAKLRDVSLLDSHGYLTLPFSTSLKATSPLTRDHKIHHVEVDLQGAKMGDSVARVYLRMSGTGVVRNLSDEQDYFVFPERLAVINASLLGSKVYDLEVYRNYRFRDRPLVNTMWELILNQRDELANQDIDLQSLSDIRVLFYYSDFTAL